MIYGYIRISTREQNEDRQRIALREIAVPEANIFMDKLSGKDLMGAFLSDIVLHVLSFVAENERVSIRQRQAEGIAAAKVCGVKSGRPPKPCRTAITAPTNAGWPAPFLAFIICSNELYSPIIEVIGLAVTAATALAGLLNAKFMLQFYLLFAVYSSTLTITAFFQRIYTQNIRISRQDVFRACVMCLIENIFFRLVFDFIRLSALIGY